MSDACDNVHENKSESLEYNSDCTLSWIDFEKLNNDASQALSYVSGYLVKKLKLPDKNCSKCLIDLFCAQ